MPAIKPFKGLVYNKLKTKSIDKVVAPPYDIISAREQEELYRKNPYNVVRLILGKTKKSDTGKNNRYTRAKAMLDLWLEGGAVAKDGRETIYIYSQEYKYGGRLINRTGFISLMLVGESGRNRILPHENTLAAPKEDRLKLMRMVNANLSPIFVLYEDEPHSVLHILKSHCAEERPFIDISLDGVRHRLWRLCDRRDIAAIQKVMRGSRTFIADGHHRYEVAKNYHAELMNSSAPNSIKVNSGYMMAYFVESGEKMLTILPTHRVVKDAGSVKAEDIIRKLERFFFVERMRSVNMLMSKLMKLSAAYSFGMYLGKRDIYILKLQTPRKSDAAMKNKPAAWKRLDVSILHLFVLQHLLGIWDVDDNIEFFKDPKDAVKAVDGGKGEMAFLLNPTKVSQVKRIAKLGCRMPRKATYFYPKPLSGLVMYKF